MKGYEKVYEIEKNVLFQKKVSVFLYKGIKKAQS